MDLQKPKLKLVLHTNCASLAATSTPRCLCITMHWLHAKANRKQRWRLASGFSAVTREFSKRTTSWRSSLPNAQLKVISQPPNLHWDTFTKSGFACLWISKKLGAGTPRPHQAGTKMRPTGSTASPDPRRSQRKTTRRLRLLGSSPVMDLTSEETPWNQPLKT